MVGFCGLFGAGLAPRAPVMVAGAWLRPDCGAGAVATSCVGPGGPAPVWFGYGMTMVLFGLLPCWFWGGIRRALMVDGLGLTLVMVLNGFWLFKILT